MNRMLIFHHHDAVGNLKRMAPSAYYMDADYSPVAVRIYAETAPSRDAKVDIFDDGVSVFENRASTLINITSGVRTVQDAATEAVLMAGENSSDLSGNLNETTIEEGSWVHCNLVEAGGGKNFTVQLELERLSSEEESL